MVLETIKKFVPDSIIQRVRRAFLFRPDDPYNLNQVMPPKFTTGKVARIQGNRWPAPGSRGAPSVPTRDSADEIYNVNFFQKDPRNMVTDHEIGLLTSKGPLVINIDSMSSIRKPTHGKRKITLLPYDPSGLRTTKTVTWAAAEKELARHMPTHLPKPFWWDQRDEILAECERKGIPPINGKWFNPQMSENYHRIRRFR